LFDILHGWDFASRLTVAVVLQCAAVSYLIALVALRHFGQPLLQINK